MKKILISLAAVLMSLSSGAVTLFPYFVDVAGNYDDGTMEEMKVIGGECMYSAHPSFYRSMDEAIAFYKDVMPFSTEKIMYRPVESDGIKGGVYFSMQENGLVSLIYLVEIPEKGFYIGYDEKPLPERDK